MIFYTVSYLDNDVGGLLQGALPAGQSDPHMREPVRQEESQADREDGQWVEQQALEDAETIALLRLGRGETRDREEEDKRRGEEKGRGAYITVDCCSQCVHSSGEWYPSTHTYWAHCDLLILQEVYVVPIPTVTPRTVGSAEGIAIGEPFLRARKPIVGCVCMCYECFIWYTCSKHTSTCTSR